MGVTIHVGEEGGVLGREEMNEVLDYLRPERIGHGILAAGDSELGAPCGELGTVLEICPTSNLLTKALPGRGRGPRHDPHLRRERRRVHDRDGRPRDDAHPSRDEFDLLLRIGALDEDELQEANARDTPRRSSRP